MRETKVETYLHEQVVAAGGWTDKFTSPGRKNVPDRIVTWPGQWVSHLKSRRHPADVHFIECKRPGKDANPGQARDHKRRRDMGCTVLVINTKALVDEYVKAWRS